MVQRTRPWLALCLAGSVSGQLPLGAAERVPAVARAGSGHGMSVLAAAGDRHLVGAVARDDVDAAAGVAADAAAELHDDELVAAAPDGPLSAGRAGTARWASVVTGSTWTAAPRPGATVQPAPDGFWARPVLPGTPVTVAPCPPVRRPPPTPPGRRRAQPGRRHPRSHRRAARRARPAPSRPGPPGAVGPDLTGGRRRDPRPASSGRSRASTAATSRSSRPSSWPATGRVRARSTS